ncbi:discoidin domain-containing receptor 2-like [Patiria miniata]|uniref:receptor protein-tyrosine kinase n=1 Tax=Patiria miniata TaxID=46514 RepID=A0A914AK67_PATMI|nr:discoidin domain-containing receptor 2-like [Patiria miniata]XP_038063803.1 discoidin domain-containing receptor 2-like [Patiria miniata]XP_038063804.1 discoidin domain-containing receptor 2-like [Patiria miniata]
MTVTVQKMNGRAWALIVWMLLQCLWRVTARLDMPTCRSALGMNSKEITDDQLEASSVYEYDYVTYGPQNARLNLEQGAGAWCPLSAAPESDGRYEYLQVNFHNISVITAVSIQGRWYSGYGQEFTPKFRLEYSRDNQWKRYRDGLQQEIFDGNRDSFNINTVHLFPPIIAKQLRVVPVVDRITSVCLRIELYGCLWADHLVRYNMVEPDIRGEYAFDDDTYDGFASEDGRLINGLGQLTDGNLGSSNYRLSPVNLHQGYEWVGWRNTTHRDPVIVFKFDSLRNFTSLEFHTNNFFSKDVELFKSVEVYFGLQEGHYSTRTINWNVKQDLVHEDARWVTVNLQNRLARFIKCRLRHRNKWILISEVSFASNPVVNYVQPPLTPYPASPSTTPPVEHETTTESKPSGPPDISRIPIGNTSNTSDNNDLNAKPTRNVPGKPLSNNSTIIAVVVVLLLLVVIVCTIFLCLYRRKYINLKHSVPAVFYDKNGTNGCMVNNSMPSRRMNPTYQIPHPNDEPQYHVIDNMQESEDECTGIYAEPENMNPTPKKGGSQSDLLTHYAETDLMVTIQGVSGNTLYGVPSQAMEKLNNNRSPVPEFPREKLKFLELLGEGMFGEVHLCEAEDIHDYIRNGFPFQNKNKGEKTLVAVKMLRKDANKNARTDFMKEMKIMSQLRDPNIVRLLAACTEDEPLCMVVEYMECGDLNQYLYESEAQWNVAPTGATNVRVVTLGALIYMATQIASGMKFLASLNFVHRDLATRNCLMGRGFTIRIADFGMSRNLYSGNYYRIEGRAVLPIRWMAWESILMGKFTTKTDVWAFGVTLWEIMTLCKEQPYYELKDEQVIENSGQFFEKNGKPTLLAQPPHCPKDIYDIMLRCWRKEPADRPSFKYLFTTLQAKNLGYEPPVPV